MLILVTGNFNFKILVFLIDFYYYYFFFDEIQEHILYLQHFEFYMLRYLMK